MSSRGAARGEFLVDWWRIEESAPSVERAIAMYDSRYGRASTARSLPTPASPTPEPESTPHDMKVPKLTLPLPSAGVVDAPRRIS
jgi:hypothetical protein